MSNRKLVGSKAFSHGMLMVLVIGVILPIVIGAGLNFIKDVSIKEYVWKISNETDIVDVAFHYQNSTGDSFTTSCSFTYDDANDVLVISVPTPDNIDESLGNWIAVILSINFTKLHDMDVAGYEITIEYSENVTNYILKIPYDPSWSICEEHIYNATPRATISYEYTLAEILERLNDPIDKLRVVFEGFDSNNNKVSYAGKIILIQVKFYKYKNIDYDFYKNILLSIQGILMIIAGVFALPQVSVRGVERWFNEMARSRRRAMAGIGNLGVVVGLTALGVFMIACYYATGSILLTLMGIFVGAMGYMAYAKKPTGGKTSITSMLGGIYGYIADSYSNFSQIVIGGAMTGDPASLLCLFGFIFLTTVLIYNVITSGKIWR